MNKMTMIIKHIANLVFASLATYYLIELIIRTEYFSHPTSIARDTFCLMFVLSSMAIIFFFMAVNDYKTSLRLKIIAALFSITPNLIFLLMYFFSFIFIS